MKSFSKLPLTKSMLENLDNLSYTEMTPIQEASIPPILEKQDLVAQAKTGSGKTAAFGIGMLHNLDFKRYRIQALVLCPTRELADQVTGELRRLARFRHNIKLLTLTGGLPMYRQELSLKHLAHIVVGTPGRVLKLLERRSLYLDDIKMIVLDEADRMLDMGFIDQVKEIFEFAPDKRQTLCFSATFPKEVNSLTESILNNPQKIVIESKAEEIDICHKFYKVNKNEKVQAVISLLLEYKPDSSIIFCNTKDMCRQLEENLNNGGIHALALHGDLEQKDRTEVLIRFANGSSRILIATDVAARGLDISKLSAVFNYDMPMDTETYVHRTGRTGRAGESGLAFTLIKGGDHPRLKKINAYMKASFEKEELHITETEKAQGFEPANVTLSINGGRKNKISPGDVLGALTKSGEITGDDIGKIDRLDFLTFIAVKREVAYKALKILKYNPIKGKEFKARIHGA